MWRRNLAFAWVAQILSLSGFGFAFPFIPFYIQELGVTDAEELRLWTGVLASAPALSMAVMAPIWGSIADRAGKKIMMLRAMLFGAIILASLSLSQSVTTVLVLRIAQGLFTGTMTAAAALVASGTPREKMSYAL
ncbi:MAG: MFS transporter, partial [Spirochaetota bacterium]